MELNQRPLKKIDERKLIVFERKILRKSFGRLLTSGDWRIMKNDELETLFHKLNVSGNNKKQKFPLNRACLA